MTQDGTARALIAELAGQRRDVLMAGCGDAELARMLRDQGCRIHGVDANQAPAAAPYLERLVVLDLDAGRLSETLAPDSFDILLLPGTLGGLKDPEGFLRDAGGLLRDRGRVIASVPNVAHGSVRLALLQGRWPLMAGRNQFTERTVLDLLERAGLAAVALRSTVADPLAAGTSIDDTLVLPRVIEWVRHQPDALDLDYVVAARVVAGGWEPRPVELVPAAPYASVRRHDRYSEQMEQDQSDRRDLLTLRDHVIGLEATTTAARARAADARARLRKANRLLKRLERGGADQRGAQREIAGRSGTGQQSAAGDGTGGKPGRAGSLFRRRDRGR